MYHQRLKRTKVFISYSHRDRKWLSRLQVHLTPLIRENAVEIWDDTKIQPSFKWQDEISEALATTKVAVLLISADFLASDFIATNELPALLNAAAQEGAIILPVILSPSIFSQTKLSQYQAVNNPARPLISLTKGDQEAVLVKIVEVIQTSLAQSTGKQHSPDDLQDLPEDGLEGAKRRINAAVPSRAALNDHLDLLVQVRLPDSELLGIEPWLDGREKPPAIKQTSSDTALEFPKDKRTGRLGSAKLILRVVAPDFEIEGGREKLLEVPPDQHSKIVKFLITAKRAGRCKIDVEVYKVDETYLGVIPPETKVGKEALVNEPSVANLVLFVIVSQGNQGLEAQYPKVTRIEQNADITKNRFSFLKQKATFAVAMIFALIVLVTVYWQINKQAQPAGNQYTGRVIDAQTQQPIQGAKVSVETQGVPQIYYTDSDGIFYLKLTNSTDVARIRIEAAKYGPFDRNVSLSRTGIEDVRLTPIIDIGNQVKQHIDSARDLYEQTKYEEAIKECDEALRLDPGNQDALKLKNDINGAIKILERRP